MWLLNSAMSLTTGATYIYLSTARSLYMFFPCGLPADLYTQACGGQRCLPLQQMACSKHVFFFIPEVPAHLCLLWLKREKKRISQQVIHCSIVLLHTTPGSWDILDVLELWSRGESPTDTVWVWCLHEKGEDVVLAWLQLGTHSKCVPVIWMFNATHLRFFESKIWIFFGA